MKNARARTPKAIFRGNSDRDNGCSDSDGAIIDRRLRRQPSRAVGPRRKTPNNGFLGVMNLIAGRRKEHGEVGQRRSPRLSKPLATGYWRPRRLSSCVSTSLCARAVLPSVLGGRVRGRDNTPPRAVVFLARTLARYLLTDHMEC